MREKKGLTRLSKLLYIEWEDAWATPQRWHQEWEADDIIDQSYIVREVGWLVRETKTHILLSDQDVPPTSEDSARVHGGLMRIPKKLILKRRNLTQHIT